jgi:hypothetical protein
MPVDFRVIEQKRVGNAGGLFFVEAGIYVEPLIKAPLLYFGDFIRPYAQGCTEPRQVQANLEVALKTAESQFDSLNNTKDLEGAVRLLLLQVALHNSIVLIEQYYLQQSQPIELTRTA